MMFMINRSKNALPRKKRSVVCGLILGPMKPDPDEAILHVNAHPGNQWL